MTFLIILLIIPLDIITIKGLKRTFPQFCSLHRRLVKNTFIIQAAASVMIVLCGFFLHRRVSDYRIIAHYAYFMGFVFTLFCPKLLFVSFLFADDIIASIRKRLFTNISRERRHIIAKGGFWTSLVFVGLFIMGIVFGRYNYTVEHVEIEFANLPDSFNGYKIVLISDIHAGNFAGSANRLQKAIDLMNREQPDIIALAGDLVNNFAEEITPLIPIFLQLYARDGKYAVLGNHDYGGYFDWDTPADSVVNHKAIENAIGQMGFVLLNNQSVIINLNNTDSIALIGTENWGIKERHPKRADLEKAMEPVRDIPFRILLTHNPLFWPESVEGKTDIALTLTGHTHGMQMGIKLGKLHLSPAMFQFRHWAGLYQTDNQYLYVNRGLGVNAFPGRIGMWPEITVITMRSGLIF